MAQRAISRMKFLNIIVGFLYGANNISKGEGSRQIVNHWLPTALRLLHVRIKA